VGTVQDEIGTHKYSPHIDEDEENKVHETTDGEKEDKEVIRYRLQVTIQRMEGDAGTRRATIGERNSKEEI
jgi:hypothetical protein